MKKRKWMQLLLVLVTLNIIIGGLISNYIFADQLDSSTLLNSITVAPTIPALPADAVAEWDLTPAWKISSKIREKICINGLWRFRSGGVPKQSDSIAYLQDFESSKLGLTEIEDEELGNEGKKGKWKFASDTSERKNGASSLRMDFSIPQDMNFYHLSFPVSVNSGELYTFSCWIKTQLKSGYIAFEVQDARGWKFLCVSSKRINGDTGWQQISVPFAISDGCSEIKLIVRNFGDSTPLVGSVWLDDISFSAVQRQAHNIADSLRLPSDEAWGYAKVPGSAMRKDYITYWHERDPLRSKVSDMKLAWYRRTANLPSSWQGKRIMLRAERVSSQAYLFINGNYAGLIEEFGGACDITEFVKPGISADIAVAVRALSGDDISSDYFSEAAMPTYQMHPGLCGFTGDVFLEALPSAKLCLGPIQIITSVNKNQITVKATLEQAVAENDISMECDILDDGKSVKKFVVPISTGSHNAEAVSPWNDATYWDIGRPKLYTMLVSLKRGGKVVDSSLPQRFGFREFEIRGRFFYLNGVKINLRPASFAPDKRMCWLSKDIINRWLDKVIEQGHNYIYDETMDRPNCHEGIEALLDACDERGLLTAITPVQMNKFWHRINEPKTVQWLLDHYRARAERVWNHPSLIMYRMNMNLDCYEQDQNPWLLDGRMKPTPDSNLGREFATTDASANLLKSIDPTRYVYHHACGNMGDVYTTNNYLCWPNLQDIRQWLHVWAANGVKPLMTAEFDLPYPGSFSLLDPGMWWTAEPMMPEYGAILLGDKSYELIEDDYLTFMEKAWDSKTKSWTSAYGYYCSAFPPIIDEITAQCYIATLRAWRTWGMSGGINPWENSIVRLIKRNPNPSPWLMRLPIPNAVLPTDWKKLQEPGFCADIFFYETRGTGQMASCCNLGLPMEKEYTEPTRHWIAIKENLQDELAYIAGPKDAWFEQDHAFYSGETLRKSVVLINDRRSESSFRVEWKVELDGAEIASDSCNISVAPAETGFVPVEFAIPQSPKLKIGKITATVSADGKKIPVEDFPFEAHPQLALSSSIPTECFIFDPNGRSSKALTRAGIQFPAFDPDQKNPKLAVLIIGSEALDKESDRKRISSVLPYLLDNGAQIIILEQNADALKAIFGLRALLRSTRTVWLRDRTHAFVKGIENVDLRDWRGKTSLGPIEGPPTDMTEEQRYKGVWRCSQQGTVCTTMVEKPHNANFHPVLDCEFDLRYTPLWEVSERNGRMIFCQLDLSDRLCLDPGADRIMANILADACTWKPTIKRNAVLVADTDDKMLSSLHWQAPATGSREKPGRDTVLILGRACSSWLEKNQAYLKDTLQSGGTVFAIGLTQSDIAALNPLLITQLHTERSLIADAGKVKDAPAVFSAISPGDLHWRSRVSVQAVKSVPAEGWRSGNGVLARLPQGNGELIWFSLSPSDFDIVARPDLILSQMNVYRTLSLILDNLRVRSTMEWSTGYARINDGKSNLEGMSALKTKDSLYLDTPSPRDNPYAYHRW